MSKNVVVVAACLLLFGFHGAAAANSATFAGGLCGGAIANGDVCNCPAGIGKIASTAITTGLSAGVAYTVTPSNSGGVTTMTATAIGTTTITTASLLSACTDILPGNAFLVTTAGTILLGWQIRQVPYNSRS